MRDQWLAMEHYRLHAVEDWPDSPRKEAALAAIRSKIKSLAIGPLAVGLGCAVCLNRARKLVAFPHSPSGLPIETAA